jgi:predicted house-cleaning noncanonical NTP pyrophosphatase (MazG superfamily)
MTDLVQRNIPVIIQRAPSEQEIRAQTREECARFLESLTKFRLHEIFHGCGFGAATHDPFGRSVFIASEALQLELIKHKVAEEAFEILKATTREELIAEVADLKDVIARLVELHKIDSEVISARQKKFTERGGFSRGFALV